MKKKSKCILLPTSQIRRFGIAKTISNKLLYYEKDIQDIIIDPQHLYILSSDEIKEGNWCYIKSINEVRKNVFGELGSTIGTGDYLHQNCIKIIATTDPELHKDGIAKISESFILKYIEMYNKGNKIEDVMVEYDLCETLASKQIKEGLTKVPTAYIPKLRPDNTIITTKVQDSFSREEVEKLIKKAFNDARLKNKSELKVGYDSITGQKKKYTFEVNNWISENL